MAQEIAEYTQLKEFKGRIEVTENGFSIESDEFGGIESPFEIVDVKIYVKRKKTGGGKFKVRI